MSNLAQYICNQKSKSFEEIWTQWNVEYKPQNDMVPFLKRLGERLCEFDVKEIEAVPESKYKEIIKNIVKNQAESQQGG